VRFLGSVRMSKTSFKPHASSTAVDAVIIVLVCYGKDAYIPHVLHHKSDSILAY
jgi:hypothetical protein